MKLILDTQTFIWWDSEPYKLPTRVLAACQDRANLVLISTVIISELMIKQQMGKVKFSIPLSDIIDQQVTDNHFELLSLTPQHVMTLEELPVIHNDPFDRLLVCQAMVEEAALVTQNSIFSRYSVRLFW